MMSSSEIRAPGIEERVASRHGLAWPSLCLALAIHVVDEALTGFLSVYNPAVQSIREHPLAHLHLRGLVSWSDLGSDRLAQPFTLCLSWCAVAGSSVLCFREPDVGQQFASYRWLSLSGPGDAGCLFISLVAGLLYLPAGERSLAPAMDDCILRLWQ